MSRTTTDTWTGPTSGQAPSSSAARATYTSRSSRTGSCAEELTRQLHELLADLSDQAFMSIRQRLVRQLLLLATPGPGQCLVVRAAQQDLADAIGSVREVVTRNLHQLHVEGLIDTRRDEIILLDPERLAEDARRPAVRA
jgi:CRP-like cAMP-binding protein